MGCMCWASCCDEFAAKLPHSCGERLQTWHVLPNTAGLHSPHHSRSKQQEASACTTCLPLHTDLPSTKASPCEANLPWLHHQAQAASAEGPGRQHAACARPEGGICILNWRKSVTPAERALAPLQQDLVLLGGGHAHVEVVRSFGMQPMPGVRVTLVTKDVSTPYRSACLATALWASSAPAR